MMSANIRRWTYDLLSHHSVERTSHHIFHLFLIFFILSNVIAVILEMTHSLHQDHARSLHVFEMISVSLFSVEWLLRVWCCVEDPNFSHPLRGRLRFIATPLMIADLLAILPFYIPLLLALDLRWLRVLRLFHIVRLYFERDDLRLRNG